MHTQNTLVWKINENWQMPEVSLLRNMVCLDIIVKHKINRNIHWFDNVPPPERCQPSIDVKLVSLSHKTQSFNFLHIQSKLSFWLNQRIGACDASARKALRSECIGHYQNISQKKTEISHNLIALFTTHSTRIHCEQYFDTQRKYKIKIIQFAIVFYLLKAWLDACHCVRLPWRIVLNHLYLSALEWARI